MNSIQFWIWVIVIVITLIARARKKKQPADSDSSPAPSRPPARMEEGPKSMTFEELLREIEAAKKPVPKPIAANVADRVDYDDHLEEETTAKAEYVFSDRQQANDAYEKAKKEAFFRPSLEETLKLQDTIIRFGQFKGYQHGDRISPAAEFAREIRNPSGFKKAFIMSEILKRRF